MLLAKCANRKWLTNNVTVNFAHKYDNAMNMIYLLVKVDILSQSTFRELKIQIRPGIIVRN